MAVFSTTSGEARAQLGAAAEVIPTPPVAAGPVPEAGFLVRCVRACDTIKLHCRQSAAGKLLINAVRPLSKLTGGILPVPNDNHFSAAVATHHSGASGGPGCLPPPPPPPAVAAAAKIKDERAQAKLRREAVAFLRGVDCHYYPEAESALIASLRADRDECVRWEAAKVLSEGCCCTPATVAALKICASGSEEDGNPAERSQRVRMTALAALQRCGCGAATPGAPTGPEPAQALHAAGGAAQLVAFQTAGASMERKTMDSSRPVASRSPAAAGSELRPRTFSDLWQRCGD